MNEPTQQNTSEEAYYLYYEDKQHGPLSSAQVRGLYLDGVIGDETPACQAGMADWQPLKVVLPELAQAAAPQLTQTQNTPPQSQSAIPSPKRCWSRNSIFASLLTVIVAGRLVGTVWEFWQGNRAARALPSASPHAPQNAKGAGAEPVGTKAKPTFEELKVKAERGEVSAQLRLAAMYSKGEGVAESMEEAIKWYRKAAEQNNASAQERLGAYYYSGSGVAKNFLEAVKWWRKAAEQNDAEAQYNLGRCYTTGEGVAKDYTEALKWYRRATEHGNASAQTYLGVCYEFGEGVVKDYAEAVKWYRKGAEQNNYAAICQLGDIYYEGRRGQVKDYVEAAKWFRKAAEGSGVAEYQYKLGLCYYEGEGVAKDYTEAVKWFRKAAEQEDRRAQFCLGVLYDNGQGVPYADKKEALRWFLMAAKRGSLAAQYNAGIMYANGEGTDKDYRESVTWFQMAADGGHADAQRSLGNAYLMGLGVLQNEEESTKWFFKAASQGQVDSQYRLGLIYKDADNAPQNQIEAHKWFNLAAAQGNEEARLERDLIAIRMAPLYLAEAKRRAAAFDPSNPASSGTSGTNGFIQPIKGQLAFQATPTERPSVQVVSTTAKVTEQNSVYWKWSYQLTLRNTTTSTLKLSATIQFTDKQGYVMGDETVYDIALRAGEQKTLTGLSLVRAKAAKTVTNVKATTKLR